MHLKRVNIQNILSFKNSDFYFNKYNVVVGANNSGKTNLIRILQFICKNSNLNLLPLDRNKKFDQTGNSRILLQLQFTDNEAKLVLQTMFGSKIDKDTFPNALKNLNVIVNWNNTISDTAHPNFLMYYFENGLTIVEKDGRQVVFDYISASNSSGTIDELLTNIQSLKMNSIPERIAKSYTMREDDSIGTQGTLLDALTNGSPPSSVLMTSDTKWWTQVKLEIMYSNQNPTQTASDILEYMQIRKNTNVRVQLDQLLHKIIDNNLTFIEEIHPTYDKLTKQLFNMKSQHEPTYETLKKEFSNIFNGIAVRVDEVSDEHGNSSLQIRLSEKDKEFNLQESASGHYALIHILYTILAKPNQILVIDEPEIHFHPIKINHLSQKLSELAVSKNNQIIIISHSPKFASYELLAKPDSSSLIYLNRVNGESNVKSLPTDFQITLKSHLFNPEVFFSNCTLIGEGAGDKFALEAISDHFGGLFKKYNIFVMQMWGVANVYPNIELHNAFDIPFIAMVDNEYHENMDNVTKLPVDLEDEYKKLGWKCSEKLKENAYSFMKDLLKQQDGLQKVKTSKIWEAFENAIKKSGGVIPS